LIGDTFYQKPRWQLPVGFFVGVVDDEAVVG